MDSVSLNLLATDPGVSKSLTVAFNNTAAAPAIQAFVSAYNSAVTTMGALTKYDASTKSAGILHGDSMVRGAQSSLRNIIGGGRSAERRVGERWGSPCTSRWGP